MSSSARIGKNGEFGGKVFGLVFALAVSLILIGSFSSAGFFDDINVTSAEHLDNNYNFISDIFGEVQNIDDIWSEPIYSGEYVQTSFEENMTNGNVINLFTSNPQGLNTFIEIYEKGGSTVLGSTPVITETKQYDITLKDIVGFTNLFDIKVVNLQNNPLAYLIFDWIHDAATGNPRTSLNFWMSSEAANGNDKASSGDHFDEAPIILNDYGETTQKCGTWDCSAMTYAAIENSVSCSGGWNCSSWNGVSCDTYTCDGWTAVKDFLDYCSGGWDCTTWDDGGNCGDWDCLLWSRATTAYDEYCSGEWNCTDFDAGGNCGNWNCTGWSSSEKLDAYCNGVWDCTTWDAGGNCGNWNCTSWANGPVVKLDVYCGGDWNCSSWNGNYCDNWECTAIETSGTVEYDYYCDSWNCSVWDSDKKVCGTWDCVGGFAQAPLKQDAYCTSGWDCTLWENFTYDETPPAQVTNLNNQSVGVSWIYWNWTNPVDADFNHSVVYVDGIWRVNTSDNYYNATGIGSDADHVITVHTVDTSSNINDSDVNDTGRTLPDVIDPVIISINETPSSVEQGNPINFTANVTDNGLLDSVWVGVNGGNYSLSLSEGLWKYIYWTDSYPLGDYNYTIYANDSVGNLAVPKAGNFTIIEDVIFPQSIRNLTMISRDSTWISWNWTDHQDIDFNAAIVYINGIWKANITNLNYTATGLTAGVNYTITVHIKDNSGNINDTDVNDTQFTAKKTTDLAFFLDDAYGGGDKGIDGGFFDEGPIQLNDYREVAEKCELWDCTEWTAGATERTTYHCSGGYNCTVWNNDSCETWDCAEWTGGTYEKIDYCASGYNCTEWNGEVCELWECPVWESSPLAREELYCDGEWDCESWNGDSCESWNCTNWASAGVGKIDEYCDGEWDCTEWNGATCGNWDCTSFAAATSDHRDVYPSSGWNCSSWDRDYCDSWEGLDWLTPTQAEDDYYCDRWNCSIWDEDKNVCQKWDCLEWMNNAAADIDYYCSGDYNCTVWKSFTYADTTAPTWDETPTNQVVEYGVQFNYDINASDETAIDVYFVNDTTNFLINSGTGLIQNNTVLSMGVYSLNISVNDSSGNVLSQVISVTVQDSSPPTWDETPTNQIAEYGTAFVYDVNASDNVALEVYFINDTENFTINSGTGIIGNNTALSLGVYSLNISVNDSSGNILSQIISVTAQDTIAPDSVSGIANQSGSYTWIYWNWTEPVEDFNNSIVYLDGVWKANTTDNFYNATGLSLNTNYTLTVHSRDVNGNINNTDVNNSAETLADTDNPIVFGLIPVVGQSFNSLTSIEIAVNVTDNLEVDIVLANVSYPNGTSNLLTLVQFGATDKYNISFTVPNGELFGLYNITFIANDSVGNLNNSEITSFTGFENIKPLIEFVSPTTATGNFPQDYIFANVTANDANLDAVVIYLYNSSGLINSSSSSGNFSINFTGLEDGTYYLNSTANDTSGNENQTETRTILLDNVAPIITINSPDSGNYNNATQLVNVTTDGDNVWYNWNGTNVTYSGALNITFAEGVNTLVVYANDSAGNLNVSNVTFTIDTIYPLIEFVSPTTSTGNFSQFYIEANVTVSDANLEMITVYLYNSSGLFNSSSGSTNPLYINFSGLADGTYYLNASVNDSAGNFNSTETRTIAIDNVAPVVSILSPTAIIYSVTSIDLNVSADGPVDTWWYTNDSGVTNYTFTPNTTITGIEGSNTIIVYANDSAGKVGSSLVIFTIDTISPTIAIVSPLNQTYTNATVLVNMTTDGDNVWYNWNGTNVSYSGAVNVTFTEGANTLYVYANDSVGNLNVSNVTFTIDTISPAIIINSPIAGIYDNATQLVNVTTDGDNVWYNWNGTNVSYSGAVNVTFTEGANTLYVYANDSVGNLNVSNVIFTIDTIPPLIDFISPTTLTGSYPQDYIEANIGIVEANLDTIIVYLYNSSGLINSSNSSTNPFYLNFSGLEDGIYYLNATVNDTLGNENSTETRTIILDTATPSIEFVIPTTEEGNYSQDYIFANITASNGPSGIDTLVIYLYNSSGLINSSLSSGDFSINFMNLSQGTYYLNASVNNTIGGSNQTETRIIILDTTAPAIDILSPVVGSYGSATINLNVSADGPVDTWWYTNDSGVTNVIFSPNTTLTGVEGSNTFVVYANDTAGNVGNYSVTFTIDSTKPIVTLISPINGTTVASSSTVAFSYNVTDDSIIENCSLIIDDALESTNITIIRNTTQSFSGVLANGNYNWFVNCTDALGNENSSVTENFTLNYVSPIIPSTGGGGSSGATAVVPVVEIAPECVNDSGCGTEQYCLDEKCYDYECNSDFDCNDTKTCWMHRCVKLFDMKIEDVASPIFPGESFPFTYYIKGVAAIHGDVIVRFWLEKDGVVVTEGFDTIYMADFEEKTESTSLFLPGTITEGTYNFYAEVNYDSYYARALRIIDVAELQEEPGVGLLTGRAIVNIGDTIKGNAYFFLVFLGIVILFVIAYWERKEIQKALVPEARWVKRYKISIGASLFFIVLLGILFYADKAGIINLSPINMSFVKYLYAIGLVVMLMVIFSRVRIRNLVNNFGSFLKSIFAKKYNIIIKKKSIKGLSKKIRNKIDLKRKKIIPFIKNMKSFRKAKLRVSKIKPKVKIVKSKRKLMKKIVRRIKREPKIKSLLEKSHPKLYEELKKSKTKLLPTKIKVTKEPEGPGRDIEKIKAIREKIFDIDKKRQIKNIHSDIKRELREIKSGKIKSRSKKLSSKDKELLKKPYPRIDEDIEKIKSKTSDFN